MTYENLPDKESIVLKALFLWEKFLSHNAEIKEKFTPQNAACSTCLHILSWIIFSYWVLFKKHLTAVHGLRIGMNTNAFFLSNGLKNNEKKKPPIDANEMVLGFF